MLYPYHRFNKMIDCHTRFFNICFLNESQNKYFVGMPEELDVEELSETRRSAAEYMDEEDDFLSTAGDSRRRPSDPGAVHSRSSGTIGAQDLATLKLRFPRLKEFSDEFLRARTMEELLKIESTSMKLKDAERRGDVEDKLSTNKQNLEANAIWVERGRDNRWSTLHSARFLAGAACSTKKLWLGARAAMDINGHDPVANYDLASVGMGGFVTSKGWVELANPASTKMALRLFNINNVGARVPGNSTAKTGGDHLEDIAEIGEFKLALRTLRTAAHFVCPWNFSFLAMENFMLQNDYCMGDLAGTESPATTLTQFVDYLLHENANRWRDADPFISTAEMKTCWTAFSSARPRVLLKKKDQHGNHSHPSSTKKTSGHQKQVHQFSKLHHNHPRLNMPFTDACRAWNVGKCVKSASNCTTLKGTPLKHSCNWSDLNNPNATVCGQNHQAYVSH